MATEKTGNEIGLPAGKSGKYWADWEMGHGFRLTFEFVAVVTTMPSNTG